MVNFWICWTCVYMYNYIYMFVYICVCVSVYIYIQYMIVNSYQSYHVIVDSSLRIDVIWQILTTHIANSRGEVAWWWRRPRPRNGPESEGVIRRWCVYIYRVYICVCVQVFLKYGIWVKMHSMVMDLHSEKLWMFMGCCGHDCVSRFK